MEVGFSQPTPAYNISTELEMKDLVITLQSKMLAQIENPVELLKYWQKVAELQDFLSTRKAPRYKERFVVDRQISAGYLHAGYPIMGPMNCEVEDALVNMERLKKDGHWGWFHELGHNHQRPPWRSIWPDMVEVTVNFFSMHTTEMMCNKPPEEVGWIRRRVAKAQEDYSGLKGDTSARMSSSGEIDKNVKGDYFGAALTMFMHLRKQFGWEFFQETFRQYEAMGKENWPNTSQGRADLWVKITSDLAKHDLVAYYESWGYPVSEEARNEIKRKKLRPYKIGLWPEKTTPIKVSQKRRRK